MHSNWLLGKVDIVKVGKDGYVQEATIAYKDTSSYNVEDWLHRTVQLILFLSSIIRSRTVKMK